MLALNFSENVGSRELRLPTDTLSIAQKKSRESGVGAPTFPKPLFDAMMNFGPNRENRLHQGPARPHQIKIIQKKSNMIKLILINL